MSTKLGAIHEAFIRLIKITDESRNLARYFEKNPTKFYRHSNCPNVPDDQKLTPDEVTQALGLNRRRSVETFIKRHTGRYKLTNFTLDKLWEFVMIDHRELNPHFPYQEAPESSTRPPIKMSESLFCFRRYQFGTHHNTSPVLLAPFNSSYFGQRLTASSESTTSINFFDRHGYQDLSLRSHSLRHFLNRLARRHGVSVETLTEWSSRATSSQTRTYLHDDPTPAAAQGALIFSTIQTHEPQDPVTTTEAEIYGMGPFHRSRYGICRRSWRAGPCNKFADCLNCSELLMCKGDMIAGETIRRDRDNLLSTYEAAQAAIASGERSASRWTEKTEAQISRLDLLLKILKDPEIPDGSPIEMAANDFCHEDVILVEKADALGVSILNRQDLGITYGAELLACLDLLRTPDNA